MRSSPAVAFAVFLASLAPASGEEIRMIGQSVMYSTKTILSNVIDSRTHRTLIKAIKSVKLEHPLMTRGQYTLFAPDDAAFAALPDAYRTRLFERVNRDAMARFLACHIIAGNETAGKPLSALVEDGASVTLMTLGGCPLTISRASGQYRVALPGGAAADITEADVPQSNGMVQLVDQVLVPAG